MRRAAKKDLNQGEIEAALNAVGAVILSVHQLPDMFDILVGFRGQLTAIEIKNPEYAPASGELEKMLTEGEMKCKQLLESVAVKYHIVTSSEEALRAIGAI